AFAEEPCGFDLDRGLAGKMDGAVDHLLDRVAHRLRAVAEDHGAHAGIVVDEAVAVGVKEVGALAAGKDEGMRLHAGAEVGADAAGEKLAALGDELRRFAECHQLAVAVHSLTSPSALQSQDCISEGGWKACACSSRRSAP